MTLPFLHIFYYTPTPRFVKILVWGYTLFMLFGGKKKVTVVWTVVVIVVAISMVLLYALPFVG